MAEKKCCQNADCDGFDSCEECWADWQEQQNNKRMENVKTLVEELRKRGLSNGASIGYHSGLMDEAADTIEQLQAEIERLRVENKSLRESVYEKGLL